VSSGHPEAFQKSPSGSAPLNIAQELEQLKAETEAANPAEVRNNSEKHPFSLMIETAQAGLKHVETHERTGLESAQAEYRAQKQDLDVLVQTTPLITTEGPVTTEPDFRPLNDPALKEHLRLFSAHLQTAERQGPLANSLKEVFSGSLHQLDKAGSTLLPQQRKAKLSQVNQETQALAKNWLEGLGADHDLTIQLRTKSQEELRHLVQVMVGDLKDYDQGDLDQLSKKKNQFIDAIVTGLQEGLQSAQPLGHSGDLNSQLQGLKREASQLLRDNPVLKQDLTMQTDTQIKAILSKQLGVDNPQVLDALLQGVLDTVKDQVSSETVSLQGLDVPVQFSLNGKNYGQPKFLDEGGFANVYRYQDLESGTFVAVKIAKRKVESDPEKIRLNEIGEMRAHQAILGTGSPHIVGLEGVVRTPQDQLLTVQEFAGGGNLRNLSIQLNALLETGAISYEQKQLLSLALLKGILQGAQHMEQQGAYHFDLKLDNYLLGSDLMPKMTDFGLSVLGTENVIDVHSEMADNILYRSPERLIKEAGLIDAAKERVNAHIQAKHGFSDPGPKPTEAEPAVLQKWKEDRALFEEHQAEYAQLFDSYTQAGIGRGEGLSAKADNWAVGTMAYELLIGQLGGAENSTHELFQAKFNYLAQRKIVEFGQSDKTFLEAGHSELGETPMDRLINALTRPKDSDRVSFSGALQSSLMQDPRLDSPAIKNILQYLLEHNLPKVPENMSEKAQFTAAMGQWKDQHQGALAQLFGQV